jgi:UDP-N-acetylmuramoyl-L-alanyl-D-glutamate--2,6-diaminopimelate ligase
MTKMRMFQKLKNYYHFIQAILANLWYGFPSKEVTVIGVTGTDGKTTTTSLIYHILKESGKKTAMITSVGAYIGDKLYDIGFHVTTPSPFAVQKYLRQAVQQGNEFVVLETTSHALDQYRVWGVAYHIGILTNITREHLDYHKTYEEYAATKIQLLKRSAQCVINFDDDSYSFVIPALVGKHVTTYSLGNPDAMVTYRTFPFQSKLIGNFNKQNCLAAICAAKLLGISDDRIRSGVKTFTPPPGRQEIVYDKEFMVIVDFAHTPNAFAVILPELKKMAKGRLIHLFGSAGLRDAGKRPLMGKEAGLYDDIIILTAEDPRTEKLEDINSAIMSGISKKFRQLDSETVRQLDSKVKDKLLFVIDDRKKAIEFAISLARKGDIVLCTGKSHEKSMNYGDGEVPWDEFSVVKNALKL